MNFVDFSKLAILVVPGLALWLTTRLAIGALVAMHRDAVVLSRSYDGRPSC